MPPLRYPADVPPIDTLEPPTTARRTPKRKRAEAMVEHILATTEALIAREGVLDLSTNRIAREAKISVGSIYVYFPNKQAIITELYRRALDRFWDELQSINADLGTEPTLAALMAAARTRITTFDRREFSQFSVAMGGMAIPEATAALRAHGLRVTGWLADILQRMGSKWPRQKLERLAALVFTSHSTSLSEAAAILGDLGSDLEDWRDHAVESLLSLALDNSN